MKKLVSAVLSLALCLSPMTAVSMNTMAAGGESSALSEEAVSCSITFEDELVIQAGETKEFHYTYTGTDKINFEEQIFGTGLIISNEYENGRGVLTVTARQWASNVHKFWCYLGDNVKDENGDLHHEGIYLVVLNILFHCPDCGRYVDDSEVVHGPMRSVCRDCYNDHGFTAQTTSGTETTTTNRTTTALTTTTTTTTPTTTTYIRSTPYGGISADSIPDEVTIHSGETVELDFTGCYLTGVKAVSSNENVVKAEAALDESSSVFINTGKITLTACNTEITITAEVEFFYDTFVPQDGGSKTIKVIVSGENDEPGTTDQSFVKELYADFPAGEKKGIYLRCYLAQNITFTSDCEYLRFERTGYNEPGRVQFSEAPNIIVIEEHYVNTPGSQTMFVYVDENAPTCKATVNMSYTSLSTGKEVKRSFDIDIFSKEDAASTTTTTLPDDSTTTTTTTTTTPIISTHETFEFSEVLSYPTKTDYKAGEELDLEGLRFEGISHTDGEKREYNDPGNVIRYESVKITDKDGNSVEWNDFSKLPAGSYIVTISGDAGDYYAYNLCNNVDISFDVTIKGTTKQGDKKVSDFIVNVVDKKSGKPVNDAVILCNHYMETAANGQTVTSAPIITIDTSKSNPFTVKGTKDINIQKLENFHTTDDSGYTLKEKDIEITEKDGNVYITIKVEKKKNTSEPFEPAGDANCDGELNMADAVFIMQCIANPDKYSFTEQGQMNADVDGSGDVTNADALKIQQFKLGFKFNCINGCLKKY